WSTSPLISSANLRRISETGAFPFRNPGIVARRANSFATLSIFFDTSSAGISNSSSRRQLASAMRFPLSIAYLRQLAFCKRDRVDTLRGAVHSSALLRTSFSDLEVKTILQQES